MSRRTSVKPASRDWSGSTANRLRRTSSLLDFPEPPPLVQATPNTRLKRFRKIRDKNLKHFAERRTERMTDVQVVNEASGEDAGELRPSILKQTVGAGGGGGDVGGDGGHSALSNGQSTSSVHEEVSVEGDERVTNGVSNGVHLPSSEEEERNASLSAAETFEVEEISDKDLGLEIFPEDVVGNENVDYIVYEDLSESVQSESVASTTSERPASDRTEAEDEYKEFVEQQEEILVEEVCEIHFPQTEMAVDEPKIEEGCVWKFEFAAPPPPPELQAPYRNPYGVSGRRPIREINAFSSSNRKRKATLNNDESYTKRRLDDSTSSGSSWSPGWRFWSVAAPQTPSEEGDSMFVNVDGKSPQQSFSTGTGSSQSNLSFGSGTSWRKYCSLM